MVVMVTMWKAAQTSGEPLRSRAQVANANGSGRLSPAGSPSCGRKACSVPRYDAPLGSRMVQETPADMQLPTVLPLRVTMTFMIPPSWHSGRRVAVRPRSMVALSRMGETSAANVRARVYS